MDNAAYMFDTIWTAAIALNNVAAKLPSGQSLLDFNYSNENLARMIYEEALRVTFFGLTVSVHSVYICDAKVLIWLFTDREMLNIRVMEIERETFDCFNTDVSFNIPCV